METKNLAELYDLEPIPWSRALEALASTAPGPDTRCFLATTRPDGRPHLAGVGAVWDDGKVYFVSGPGTRKSRNLAENANCAVSMALPGMDLVFEGVAERVTDDATLQRLAKRYADGGWPAEGRGRRLHLRLQRAERRTAAVVPLRARRRPRSSRAVRGAGRRDPLALSVIARRRPASALWWRARCAARRSCASAMSGMTTSRNVAADGFRIEIQSWAA